MPTPSGAVEIVPTLERSSPIFFRWLQVQPMCLHTNTPTCIDEGILQDSMLAFWDIGALGRWAVGGALSTAQRAYPREELVVVGRGPEQGSGRGGARGCGAGAVSVGRVGDCFGLRSWSSSELGGA